MKKSGAKLSANSCLQCRPSGQLTAAQSLKREDFTGSLQKPSAAVRAKTFFFFFWIPTHHLTPVLQKETACGGVC